MATGHFGYTENSKEGAYGSGRGSGANTSNYNTKNYKTNANTNNGYANKYEVETKKTTFVTSEVTSPKGLSYEDLRKFMWS